MFTLSIFQTPDARPEINCSPIYLSLNSQPTTLNHLQPVTRPAGIGLWVLRQKSSAVEKPDPVSGDNR
jgi:hypothetical protein